MANDSGPDLWMTRTSQNVIAGPFTRAEITARILDGTLKLQDEVGRGNDYWFFLHEAPEVTRFLGITVPRQKRRDDDDTQTETETQTQTQPAGVDRTDPDLRAPAPIAAQGPAPSASAPKAVASRPIGGESPYSENEEEVTDVQSLDIAKEIAARIERTTPPQESVKLESPPAAVALESAAATEKREARDLADATAAIDRAGSSRKLWLVAALVLLGLAIGAAFVWLS